MSKKYYFDIDGTICNTPGIDYDLATPIMDRIEKINKLYDDGNVVIYWTARGAGSNDLDYITYCRGLTLKQLGRWGCKYTTIEMNKPLFDSFYDDRAFNAKEIDTL